MGDRYSRIFLPIFVLFLIASFVSFSDAQSKPDHSEILLNSGAINTSAPEMQAARNQIGSFDGNRLHLVQLAGPTRDEAYDAITKTGVRIVTYIPYYAYLVYGDSNSVAGLQSLASSAKFIQWDGPFLDEYKIHPYALPNPPKGVLRTHNTDLYSIQLVEDEEVNSLTLAAIGKWQLEAFQSVSKELGYVNIKVRLVPESVFEIAKQPDVVSIQIAPEPQLNDERQDVIISGNLTGGNPTGPGYLSFLASKGFNQAQFSSSGFGVDVSDDGVDNGTATPLNAALFELGNKSNPDRLVYVRREPAGAGEIRGCFGHGNLNTHIVAGYNDLVGFPHEDGGGFNYNVGVCPFVRTGASVIFTPGFTFPDFEDLQSRAYNDGMRLSTNSWGASVGGAYNSDSQRYDALVRDAQPTGSAIPAAGNQEMVILFSAGNDGPSANSVGSPGTGKNVITVGAAENVQAFGGNDGCGVGDAQANDANDLALFSSRGPCDDGRVKPDIVAPGTHVTAGVFPVASPPVNGQADACFNGSSVCGGVGSIFFPPGQQWTTASTGTSHSTPAVAGGAALLRQYFINSGNNPPSPAMTKAYLTNSARDLTGTGGNDTLPSHRYGMGELNLGTAFDGAARIVKDEIPAEEFSTSGQSQTFTGFVLDASKPFRVTLAWTDAPGPTAGNAFVNNLDLTVTINGNTYKGNVFSGANSITGGSADPANNLESVFLPAGTTGNFVITVNATNIAGDGVPGDGDPTDQDFALVCYNCVEGSVPVIANAGATITDENCLPADGIVGPGETVTIDFALQNIGTLNTTNLVATLQSTGGVINPSAPQNYGVLPAGGAPVTKSFTFTASASCGQTVIATFDLQDGATNLGTAVFTFPTGTQGSHLSYSYTGPNVAIPDNNPNGVNVTLNVAGFPGLMSDVNFSIDGVGPCSANAGDLNNGITHTWVGDLIVRLTSPSGTSVTFINRPGAGTLGASGNNICNTIFDDESGGPDFDTITNAGSPPLGPPYTGIFTPQSPLSPFEGQDPNGTWTVNISDNAAVDTGSLNRFTIRLAPFNCCSNICPTITVNPSTLPNGTNGVLYDQTVSATGGTAPYTFAVSSGTLPTGVTLNSSTGQITGTPTAVGTFNFEIKATDANGCSGKRSYTVIIDCAPITLSPATLPNGSGGHIYDQTVSATGGTAPYTFAVTSGALPTGLNLNTSTGRILGTPTVLGMFNFDITATDSSGCTGVRSYSITINCAAISVLPPVLPNGVAGTFYDQTVSGFDGVAPYTFAVTSGTLPTGLTLNPVTGQVSGTPSAAGLFLFDITATDVNGCSGLRGYQLTISCPTITVSPATLPGGTTGVLYDQTVSAIGGTAPHTFNVTSGVLPTGLTLNATTGQITGTPTAAGTFNFTITATDIYGCTGSTAYSVTIQCPIITVDPTTLPNGTVGTAYDQTVSASGGTAPYTFAVTNGNLPTGLTLDTNTGQISGTPTAAGTFNFDITATDTYGCTGVRSYSITMDCPVITVSPSTLPNGTIGVVYDQTVSGSGGTAPYIFAVTNGSLPTGLTLDSNSGQITGTPTALGTFNFDITATDTYGCTGTQSYSITINCPVITVNPATLPNGTVGTPYDQTISGSGGAAPYTFAVTNGSLPTGLTLNTSTGQISGTPTAAGTFNFDITATDSNGCTGVTSYSVTMSCPTITVSPTTLPNGTVGTLYDQTVSASGGTAPYTFTVTNGNLPTGLTLDANTGQITGTPTALGTFNFDITATDTYGCSGTRSYSVTINCPVITVLPATLPNGTVGTLYDQTVSGSGGAGPYTFAVTNGSLPSGLTLNTSTGQISGTPSAAGTFNFDITATDANGCTGVTSYSITMNCPVITVNPATLPNGIIGVLYDQTVSGSGGTAPYTFAVTNGSLPTGLTLDSNTGQITGTPTALGTFNFDITATDTYGCSGTRSYSVTINCPVITVLPATLPNGTVGTFYDQTVSGSGGAAPYTFAVTNGSLPTGLTLNTSTGQISGTPIAAGTSNFDITATDANGCSGVQSYSITMTCPVITVLPATLPGGTTGVLYDQTVSGSGGTAPYTFALTGSLPNGLTLNPTTGQISGTPSVTGIFNFDITATDANGCSGVTSYSVTIGCPAITILPATLPGGTTGILYDQTVSGAGGTAPYTFNVSSGSLPNGLTLNSATGQISGTPTLAGTFNFDIIATDLFGCIGTTSYSVTISCAAITVNPATLPDGILGTLYDQTVSGSGGTAPYTFAVTNGSLPTGLTLDANTGQITGTPSVLGAFSFDITATDANNCSGVASYTVNINLPCLFCDEFDDGTVDGNWTYIKHMTDWTEDGTALIGHPVKKKTQALAIPIFQGCITCNAQTILRTAGGAYNRVWFMFHVVDKDNLVELMMKEEDDKWVLKHRINKKIVAKAKFLAPIDPNIDYAVSIRYDGTNYIVNINGTDVITMAPGAATNGGSIGFKVKGTTGTFQRIQVN